MASVISYGPRRVPAVKGIGGEASDYNCCLETLYLTARIVLLCRTYGAREHLGEFEHIVLLAVLRLGDDAYGVPIRLEIERRTGRSLTVGALYRTLDRLEAKGYVTSSFGDPSPERGGRSRRYFRMRPLGLRTLRASRDALAAMWEGLEPLVTRGS